MHKFPSKPSYDPGRSHNCQADRDIVNARGGLKIDSDAVMVRLAGNERISYSRGASITKLSRAFVAVAAASTIVQSPLPVLPLDFIRCGVPPSF